MPEKFGSVPSAEKPIDPVVAAIKDDVESQEYGSFIISQVIKNKLIDIAKKAFAPKTLTNDQIDKIDDLLDRLIDDRGQGADRDAGIAINDVKIADYVYYHPEDQSDDRTENTFYEEKFKKLLPQILDKIKNELKKV